MWGVSFVNTKVLLDHALSPTEIFVYRFIIAYVGLLAIMRFKVTLCPWRDEALMAILGLTGGTAYFIFQNMALDLTLVSDVVVLVAINPLLTTLLAAIFLREEHFTWLKVGGSLLAFGGVSLLTFYKGFVWGDGLLGDLLAILAALSWAIYSVILKRLNDRYSTLLITRKTFFYGLVAAIPILRWQGHFTPLSTLSSASVAGNLLFLALFCSMLAFFMWGRVTKHIGAISSNNYLYLSPVVSIVCAWVIYDERVGALGLLGCALVLLGIVLVQHKQVNS